MNISYCNRFIVNFGCYVIVIELVLYFLISNYLICVDFIIVDVKSGFIGVGKKLN